MCSVIITVGVYGNMTTSQEAKDQLFLNNRQIIKINKTVEEIFDKAAGNNTIIRDNPQTTRRKL